MKPVVVVCDDDDAVRFAIGEALEALDADVLPFADAREALDAIERAERVDVVLTDLVMPNMDGFALLKAVREHDLDLPVIMLTARGSERVAVDAIKGGAYDYLAKPFAIDELRIVVRRAIELRELRRERTAVAIERATGRPVIGSSSAIRRVMDAARRVGSRDVTVLVRGETGTGKELVASTIHAASARRKKPCIRFNCAAISPELAEAELFGHARGAFTGATSAREGFFQKADGGTLVLDEIGELPAPLQAKLLRAVQEGEVQPVGASSVAKVDVRIVALTHRDLRAEVEAGRFRADLLFRLAVVELVVPALRDRTEDIPLLVEAFREHYARKFGIDDARFSDRLVQALAAQAWPGNVRELENTVARLLALSEGGPIDVDSLGTTGRREQTPDRPIGGLRSEVDAFESGLIERTLAATNGNQSEAARRLGISRMTLIEKMKRHGVKAKRRSADGAT